MDFVACCLCYRGLGLVRFGNWATALDSRTHVALCARPRTKPGLASTSQRDVFKDISTNNGTAYRFQQPQVSLSRTLLYLQMQLGVQMRPRLQLLSTCCCALCKAYRYVCFCSSCRSLKLSHLKRKAEDELKRSNYGHAAERCATVQQHKLA